jgi:hypothetical protein
MLYFPLSILLTAAFLGVCVAIAPFAYLLTTFGLMRRICEDYELIEGDDPHERIKTFLNFLVLGPIVVLLMIPVDGFKFYYNLFTKPPLENSEEKIAITQECLDQFKTCLDAALREKRRNDANKSGPEVNAVSLIRIVRRKFGIMERISTMLFKSRIRYVFDEELGKLVCVDPNMRHVQIFNSLKALVFKCANKDGMVDTELLNSLAD